MTKLSPCPCGEEVTDVHITPYSVMWSYVSGDCCDKWFIIFRNKGKHIGSPDCERLAIEAWNNAPRGKS